MITIITYWEDTQMDPELEWRMWRQLRGAFSSEPGDMQFKFVPFNSNMSNRTFEQYDSMDEALSSATGIRVFLEPSGTETVAAMPQDQDIVFLYVSYVIVLCIS